MPRLLRTLQRERTLVKFLVDLGLTTEQAIELLIHPVHLTSHQPDSSASSRDSARAFSAQGRMGEADAVEEKKTFSLSPKISEYLEVLVDANDRQEGGDVILYWNDLAVDTHYANSNSSVRISFSPVDPHYLSDNSQLTRVHVMSLFSPMFRIRQNLVNVILVLDLS